ncbi:sigma-54 interaction domain-containing protein [Thiocapsa sp. UBA6158]|jgi:DNA-binding NtrC family response regulator|uniref:sigma-54 interaction domain-containing protein n=1 Tax=Thiocapsa sp. UBA6158 TaxID=1947692 RepID=UPI0025FFE26A|nr:sigma-54 dependent transcriptional regulator [Thiocapsa sp. UBA6158]
MNVLVSWVGQTDLDAAAGDAKAGIGPIGQALTKRAYDLVVLLNNYPEARCSHFLPWVKTLTEADIRLHRARLTSPTDFGEIYKAATSQVAAIIEAQGENAQLTFHLSPGTSAMAAVWIILAKTRFPAELIESSIEQGVRTVAIPFDISADFIPDLLRRPDAELTRLTAGLPPAAPAFDAIVHQSEVMQRVIARARRVALRSIPVSIEGESGTGKELLARAIHQASPRRGQSIVTVNCGAIAPELIESELFGHEKGAFTGAAGARQGVFEAAHRGTLFLDEVGELPKSAQVRFLRALQEGEITRVGANQAIRFDVRIIAATNRSLTQEVSAGRFREDLFYRLAVAVIALPPLRERDGDTSLLLERLLEQVNRESETEPGFEPKKLSVNARKLLLDHPWPGNVRELLNTLRRAAVWTPEPLIDADDARDALLPSPGKQVQGDPILSRDVRHGLDLHGVIERVARHYLAQAMHITGNNKARASKLLGFGNATTLTNWLKRYGVEP